MVAVEPVSHLSVSLSCDYGKRIRRRRICSHIMTLTADYDVVVLDAGDFCRRSLSLSFVFFSRAG